MSDNRKNPADDANPVNREMFEKWLPVFQDGVQAQKEAQSDDYNSLSRSEQIKIRRRIREGDDAFAFMCERIMIIAKKIIQTEVDRPRTFHVLIEYEDLEAAAIEGIRAALLKLDLDKMKNSNLNLILQYVTTKVSREALKMEAGVGISPSKLRLYKKIAAVRSSLKARIGHEPSDEEVLDYFHSGKADYKTMNGKSASKKQPFKTNATIRLKDIQDQRELDSVRPFMNPVTDEKEIDASLKAPESSFSMNMEENAAAEDFWTGYMTWIGISEQDMSTIVSELELYALPADWKPTMDKHASEQMARDFLHLIQNRKGRIQEYANDYTETHGEGFWSVFSEQLTSDFKPKTTTLTMKLLKLNK